MAALGVALNGAGRLGLGGQGGAERDERKGNDDRNAQCHDGDRAFEVPKTGRDIKDLGAQLPPGTIGRGP